MVICSVADDADRARAEAAAQLAFYMAPRTYRPLLDASGFGGAGAAVRDAFEAKDFEAMARAVPDEMVDAMAAAGTPAEARARLDALGEVFDHVIVYPPSFGLSQERCDELSETLVDELAPGRS